MTIQIKVGTLLIYLLWKMGLEVEKWMSKCVPFSAFLNVNK